MKIKKDEVDSFMEYYKQHMPKTIVLAKNKPRYDEVMKAIEDISNFVWETDSNADIDVYPDDLTGCAMCVKIVASLVVIEMVDKFCEALGKANNFEIYPRTDGNVCLGIVFEDVFKPAPPHNEPFPEFVK